MPSATRSSASSRSDRRSRTWGRRDRGSLTLGLESGWFVSATPRSCPRRSGRAVGCGGLENRYPCKNPRWLSWITVNLLTGGLVNEVYYTAANGDTLHGTTIGASEGDPTVVFTGIETSRAAQASSR